VDNHWENDYTNNNHNNSNILPTLVEKTIDEVEKMNPDQKLAYERHLNYHKMLEKGEKFHCHRCGFELSPVRVMYLSNEMGLSRDLMKCEPCRDMRATVNIGGNAPIPLAEEAYAG
jgi:hypothetical protein